MDGLSAFSPPLSEHTPFASLSGWDIMLHCSKCGLRRKPADSVKVPRGAELGAVLSRLVCDRCRVRPPRITAACAWALRYGAGVGDIDLTGIAQPAVEKAA